MKDVIGWTFLVLIIALTVAWVFGEKPPPNADGPTELIEDVLTDINGTLERIRAEQHARREKEAAPTLTITQPEPRILEVPLGLVLRDREGFLEWEEPSAVWKCQHGNVVRCEYRRPCPVDGCEGEK